MDNKRKKELFIDQIIEAIIESEDVVKDAASIRQLRDDLIQQYDLDIDSLSTSEIVNNLKFSKYKYFYQHLNFEDLANVIFLNRIQDYDMKSSMEKMIVGMNEKNYQNSIYSYEEIYGIELTNVAIYLGITEENQKLEMKSNFATFIEYYYGTAEGKAFINDYQSKIQNGYMPQQFFDEIFEKMNKASVVQSIIKDPTTGKYSYKSGSGGDLDGLFVIFDDDSNMTFNVSTTASKNVEIEKTSVIRHAITSKFISEAIVKEIDKELTENKLYIAVIDNKEVLKAERNKCWEFYANDENMKATFIKRALKTYIQENNLNIEVDYNGLYNKKTLTDVEKFRRIIKELNAQEPDKFMNQMLKTTGKITENKINVYFKSGNEFKTNFVTNLNGIRDSVLYSKSKLKENMDKSKVGMFEFKTFLQTTTLKNVTLKSYLEKFEKPAIDSFFDNIIVRRVFAKLNQHKLNDKKFLQDVERLIINDFVLKPKEEIEKNKSFLNVHDLEHLNHYLKYILFNKKEDPQAFQKKLGYMDEKLQKLGVDSTPLEILMKIKENYPDLIEKSDDLIDKVLVENERDQEIEKRKKAELERDQAVKREKESQNAAIREAFIASGHPVPPQYQLKNDNDEIDYSDSQKSILSVENSIKQNDKTDPNPTIKRKLQ